MRNVLFSAGAVAVLALPLLAGSGRNAAVASPPAAQSATARSVEAAQRFLATVGDSERARALFPFDGPQKTNWSNLPSGIFERHSLRLGDLTPAQHEAAMALVSTVLSREGYQKVTDIMNGDEVLQSRGGGRTGGRPGGGGRGGGVRFGLAEYYIGILGTPSTTSPWMVQFGGHHLAINVTIAGRASVLTPSLPAAQPATYTLNGRSIRPLGDEHDKSVRLIGALDAAARSKAVLDYRVADLVLGAGQDGKTIAPEGIPASALTPAQQEMLLDLAHEWVGILNDEGAAAKMAEIRSNLARTYFAWSGPTEPGSLAYFRIQGPTLHIEYAPQQNDPDHIHTIYRDPTNDYGARLVSR
ncbi:MAG: DUF3500 domain-containing protein [Acidobacteria bacterium]|nr:DUF3500 domain-containing protein [Acidobacteriota bacterium]